MIEVFRRHTLIALITLLLSHSCSEEIDNTFDKQLIEFGVSKYAPLEKMDVSDAIYLYVINDTLYKLTDKGESLKVLFLRENGESVNISPSTNYKSIKFLSSKYLYIDGYISLDILDSLGFTYTITRKTLYPDGYSGALSLDYEEFNPNSSDEVELDTIQIDTLEYISNHYFYDAIVNLETGAFYKLPNDFGTGIYGNSWIYSNKYLQSDKNGNLYFVYDGNQLYQFTFKDDVPFAKRYLLEGQTSQFFFVDKEGNVFYNNRMKSANGGISFVDDQWGDNSSPRYFAFQGSVVTVRFQRIRNIDITNVLRLEIQDDTVATSLSFSPLLDTRYNFEPIKDIVNYGDSLLVLNEGNINNVGWLLTRNFGIRIVYLPQEYDQTQRKYVGRSESYLYYEDGNKKLIRFSIDRLTQQNIPDGTSNVISSHPGLRLEKSKEVLFPKGVDIYSYEFGENDRVLFTGLDNRQEEYVAGYIKEDNAVIYLVRTKVGAIKNLTQVQ